jgi:CHAT domain-containing protein
VARKWLIFLRYLQSILRWKSPLAPSIRGAKNKTIVSPSLQTIVYTQISFFVSFVSLWFRQEINHKDTKELLEPLLCLGFKGYSKWRNTKGEKRRELLFKMCVHRSLLRGVRWGLILLTLLTLLTFTLPSLATPHHTQNDQGKLLYDTGRFAEAVEVLKQAAQEYQKNGDIIKQAATLGNLSLAYQRLGNWKQASDAISLSLRLQEAKPTNQNLLAQTLIIQGRLLFSTGQTDAALQAWKQAEKVFEQAGNKDGSLKARINQAQSLQILGYYYNAVKLLKKVNLSLSNQTDSVQKLLSLRLLGDALQLVGDLNLSHTVLQQSLKIAQNLNNNTEIAASLFSLGNHALFARKPQQAIEYYQQTVHIALSPLIKVQALLNHLGLEIQAKKYTEAKNLISSIESLLQQLPPSRAAIYARINFAGHLKKIENDVQRPSNILTTAIQIARSLNDNHAYAYALSELGELYEKTQQYSEALRLTQNALSLLQPEYVDDVITYQLQWQLARLLRVQGDIKGAIAAYDAAVETLSNLRTDLVAVNQDIQFNFKESVEPVYRQSVALLLESGRDEKSLDKARQYIEALQLAELDNFFKEACVQGKKVVLDQVVDKENPNTAILYPIILADKLQVIVKIPNQKLKLYTANITQAEVEATVTQFRRNIVDPSATENLKTNSQKLYTWLFQQVKPDLAPNVNTLVFVPDTVLRSIPFAALFDGKNYLIENYAISINAGLQLLNPKPLQKQNLNALTAGLVEPPHPYQTFARLPGIESELKKISEAGIKTKTLLNQKFTSKELDNLIHDMRFNIVHLATHGKFSSRAEDTFILAADGPINVRDLDNILRSRDDQQQAIQLLVLSACQTAEGDKRAALGLAGVALKAGARSTLASLWQIEDEPTAVFVGEFYRELKNFKSKAEALQQAQLKLLNHPNYRAPVHWAAYVLIGNWL